MEPESGSEGSSTVEPVQVTRTRTTTAVLGAMLMHSIKRLASEADKAGRRPVIMLHYIVLAQRSRAANAAAGSMPSYQVKATSLGGAASAMGSTISKCASMA